MATSFKLIDKQLRLPGRIAGLFMRPSERGLRFLHRALRRAAGNDMVGAVSRTVSIARSDGNGMIRTRIFRPHNAPATLPIVLCLHGGGYAIGTPEQANFMRVCAGLMAVRDCVVVAPDYRLSLDAPYPAGLHDCYDSLLWAKENAAEIGGRTDQIFVMGDSGGGGLAVAVCLLARDRGDVAIAFQMPLYPMLDDRQINPSAVNNTMPIWNSRFNALAWKLYLRGLVEKGEPIPTYASPSRATDYTGLPPAATFVGDLDPFLDETVHYVERLKAAAIPVQFQIFEGCYHGFEQVVPTAAVSQAAVRFIQEAFAYAVDNYTAAQPNERYASKSTSAHAK